MVQCKKVDQNQFFDLFWAKQICLKIDKLLIILINLVSKGSLIWNVKYLGWVMAAWLFQQKQAADT
jgi:hypothetical protein